MVRSYSFIIFFLALLGALSWGAGHLAMPDPATQLSQLEQRRDVIEALQTLVAQEHEYRSAYGHFTQVLNRLEYRLPPDYAVQVTEAGRDRLIITAFSEVNGRIRDIASIDHDSKVRANFTLPEPRLESQPLAADKLDQELDRTPSSEAKPLEIEPLFPDSQDGGESAAKNP